MKQFEFCRGIYFTGLLLHHCRPQIIGIWALAVLTLAVTACAPQQSAKLRYLLPVPPDTPRIEWLGTYKSEVDFPNYLAKKKLEYLTGVPVKTPLKAPSGIVSDGDGTVFVGDLQYRNILVFNLNNWTITPLLKEASVEPRQLALDSHRQLYVADSEQRTVRVFSRDGEQLRSYGGKETLQKPLGVAIDEGRQRLYVSDGAANLVRVFDLESGQLLLTMGSGYDSRAPGDLHNPVGLAVAKDGRLYVMEHLNARISVFNPDGTFAEFIGTRSSGLDGFENPRDIAIDSEGNLWVADFRRKALRAFDTKGRLLFILEESSEEKSGFLAPAAIHVDENDEIYVADILAGRFSHWRYLSKKALARHPITEEDLERINAALAPEEEEDFSPSLVPEPPAPSPSK